MTSEARTIATTTHGRYLVERIGEAPRPPLFVGFHGYAQTAEVMLDPLRRIAPDGSVIVSIQALHRFYARDFNAIVANWMTSQDRESMIADNAEYVGRVLDAVKQALPGPCGPLFYVGFSQGVAMAFRAAALAGHETTAVISLGGDLPPDIGDAALARFPRVLIGRGSTEEWYTEEKLTADMKRLRDAGVRFEAKIYVGGHEWTEEFFVVCQGFVNSVLSREQQGDSVV